MKGSISLRRLPALGPTRRRPDYLCANNKRTIYPQRRCLHLARTRTSPHYEQIAQTPCRSFIASAQNSPPNTTITSHRLLPYPTMAIFDLITDIASYPKFLPYCRSARVNSLSPQPDRHYSRKWPHTADMTVGFQDRITETFTSRVFCLPPVPEKGRAGIGWVEAISGAEVNAAELAGMFGGGVQDDLAHHFVLPKDLDAEQQQRLSEERKASNENSPLAYLRSRWTVQSIPYKPGPDGQDQKPQEISLEPHVRSKETTEVSLAVEFRFRSPIYEMMSKTVTGKVADMMVQAFVGRVEEVLGKDEANR